MLSRLISKTSTKLTSAVAARSLSSENEYKVIDHTFDAVVVGAGGAGLQKDEKRRIRGK